MLGNAIRAAKQGPVLASAVEWAAYAARTAIEDVGIDHRGADVFVAEQLLDGSDVVAVLEKMCGK
jgi:hypothetical protein